MTEFISVYITVAAQFEADLIARTLVEDRLAACVNSLPGLKSIYHWEGQIEESQEILLIAKTRTTLFEPLCDKVKSLHSYECPCIVAEPIMAGHQPFLEWLAHETRP